MKRLLYHFGFIFLSLFCSCDESIVPIINEQDESKKFFPLLVDKFWIYEVDSILYNRIGNNVEVDSLHYIFRETLIDTFRNEENKLTFRILKEKNRLNNSWEITDVYSIVEESARIIQTEENIPLVNLVFPLKLGISWNPLIFIDKFNTNITIKNQSLMIFNFWNNSFVKEIKQEEVLGNLVDVLTVEDVDEDDQLFSKQYSVRKYAKNIGLIFKHQEFFASQQCASPQLDCFNIPWEEKVDVGFKVNVKLLQTN